MDINLTTPNLENVLTKGNTNGDLDITSADGRGVLHASSSSAGASFTNGGVGEYANIQLSNTDVTIEHNALLNISAPDTNTDGNITATLQVAAQNFKVNGTNGAGHIDLKHQASDATSPASSTALWADSNGDIKWKIDGNYKTILKASLNTADRTYTFQNANGTLAFTSDIPSLAPYLTIAAAAAAYEPIFSKGTAFNRNFGTSSGDILLSVGTTASQILATDSSNKVTTLSTSTYPSLTELSYVKGVTSSIQTQFANVGEWLQLGATTFNPADSTTYYVGLFPSLAPGTSTAGREFTFINTGTVTRFIITYENSATGTSENVAVYLRNNTTATDNFIGNITMDAGANQTGAFIFTPSVTISNTTDKYSIKIVTPAWVTNPTTVYTSVRLLNKF